MNIGDWLVPTWLVMLATLAGAIGAFYMLASGHSRVMIMVAISLTWMTFVFALSWFGILDDFGRVVMLRAGVFVLGLSLAGAAYVRMAHRARNN